LRPFAPVASFASARFGPGGSPALLCGFIAAAIPIATLIIRDRRGVVAGTIAFDAEVSFKAAAAGVDPNVGIIGDMKPEFSVHAAACHGKLEHRVHK
jgi:hypothetical protein